MQAYLAKYMENLWYFFGIYHKWMRLDRERDYLKFWLRGKGLTRDGDLMKWGLSRALLKALSTSAIFLRNETSKGRIYKVNRINRNRQTSCRLA